MAFKYLIVEDSKSISDGIKDYFETNSRGEIIIEQAFDGEQGLSLINNNKYDLILLDIMLPYVSGFEILRAVRSTGDTPVFMMTALGSEGSILHGYDLGADDYIVKPFNVKELYAKTSATVKRYKGAGMVKILKMDELELNTYSMVVTVDGNAVDLSPKEYFLLKLLMENPERVFSRSQLINAVWEYDFDGTERVVDNHIKKLRKNLGRSGERLITVFGRGYKIV